MAKNNLPSWAAIPLLDKFQQLFSLENELLLGEGVQSVAFIQLVEKPCSGKKVDVDIGKISVGGMLGVTIETVGTKVSLNRVCFASAVCVVLIANSIGAVFSRKAKYATETVPTTPITAIIIVVMFCEVNRGLLILLCLFTLFCKGRANGLRYLRWGRDGEAVQPEK